MTTSVQFNGATLIRPGAYSKLDTSAFNTALISGLGVVALIGEADFGPDGVQEFFSYEAIRNTYLSGDLVDAASILVNPSNDPRVPGGPSKILCVKTNTDSGAAATANLVDVSGDCILLSAKAEGTIGNLTSVITDYTAGPHPVTSVKSQVQVTATRTLNGVTTTEVGVVSGPKFNISQDAATLPALATDLQITVTASQIDIITVGGASAGTTNFLFSTYPNFTDLMVALEKHPGVKISNNVFPGSTTYQTRTLDSTSALRGVFDNVSTLSFFTNSRDMYALAEDVVTYLNAGSNLVTAIRLSTQTSHPSDQTVSLGSATAGVNPTSNSTGITVGTWGAAIDLLENYEVNQLIPLLSYTVGSSDFTAVAVKAVTHAASMSSTTKKKEREAWIGMRGSSATPDVQNLSDITTLANAFNTEHAVMTSSQVYLPRGVNGTLQFYPEWGAAVAMAGMRAGADIGEPLTFKNMRTFGVQYSWWATSFTQTLDDNIKVLLLNGVCPVVKDLATNAFKIEKCVTTYISSQNNALSEESIVQGLKAVTANLRRNLDAFTGTKATLAQVQSIKDMVKVVLTSFGPEATGGNGFLIRSVGDDGSEIPPYRDIIVTIGKFPDPSDVARVSVTVTPVSGINFILNTVFAVPAQLSSSVI